MSYHLVTRGYQNRLKKWNKKIYIASLIESIEDEYTGEEILVYDEPKMYMMNVQPLTATADIQEWGTNVEQMQKAVIEYDKYFGIFKEGDVAYLDGATPEGEPKNGAYANYRLYPPRNQNKCIRLFFKRINTK